MNREIILKYFPELTERQMEQFAAIEGLYEEWNGRINVISRREMTSGEFYPRHVLHSLAIARACRFDAGARVLDIGTGGGFPAIPLAIMFPEVHFTAVDSIGKKIMVVGEVARCAGIANVTALNARVESVQKRFVYAVSRAVAPAATLLDWIKGKIERGQAGTLPNGVLFLKGGDLASELAETGRKFVEYNISDWFDSEFFETKKVVYIEKR
jgi:16S rRNA (guanine527-N7)-methyltransferase